MYNSAAEAIERSQSHNEIAHIDLDDFGGGDPAKDRIRTELENEAEDWVDANGVREFWGENARGEWRVHVKNF